MANLNKVMQEIKRVAAQRRKRVTTGQMNRFLERVDFQKASVPMNRRVRIYYMTQAAVAPPTFVLFTDKDVTKDIRMALLPKLKEAYRKDSDPGLHAANEWLLRHWKEDDFLAEMNLQWAKDVADRERRLIAIQHALKIGKQKAKIDALNHRWVATRRRRRDHGR